MFVLNYIKRLHWFASAEDLKWTHTSGFPCFNPTGTTVIIIQPASDLGPETPEEQSKPILLPLPMPPPEPQLPPSANTEGEENPRDSLQESKWLVRAASNDLCPVLFPSFRFLFFYFCYFTRQLYFVASATWLTKSSSFPFNPNNHPHVDFYMHAPFINTLPVCVCVTMYERSRCCPLIWTKYSLKWKIKRLHCSALCNTFIHFVCL